MAIVLTLSSNKSWQIQVTRSRSITFARFSETSPEVIILDSLQQQQHEEKGWWGMLKVVWVPFSSEWTQTISKDFNTRIFVILWVSEPVPLGQEEEWECRSLSSTTCIAMPITWRFLTPWRCFFHYKTRVLYFQVFFVLRCILHSRNGCCLEFLNGKNWSNEYLLYKKSFEFFLL